MSIFDRPVPFLVLGGALLMCSAHADESPQLGEPLTAADVAAVDFTVLPDGRGLPPGSGSVERGAGVYRQHCAACHGADGQGKPNDQLAGGIGSLASDAPRRTVGSYWPYATTLFDYIRRAMPYQTPGRLIDGEIYSVTAYVLHLSGVVGPDTTLDAETLPSIEMPNRNGFVSAPTAAHRQTD